MAPKAVSTGKATKKAVEAVVDDQSSEEETTTRGKTPKPESKAKSTAKPAAKGKAGVKKPKTEEEKAEAKLKKEEAESKWENKLIALMYTREVDDEENVVVDGNTNVYAGLSSKEEFGKLSTFIAELAISQTLAIRDNVGADEIYDACNSSVYRTTKTSKARKPVASDKKPVFKAKTKEDKLNMLSQRVSESSSKKNTAVEKLKPKPTETVDDTTATSTDKKPPTLKSICSISNSGKFAVGFLVNRVLNEINEIDPALFLNHKGNKNEVLAIVENVILENVFSHSDKYDCSVSRLMIVTNRTAYEADMYKTRGETNPVFDYVKSMIEGNSEFNAGVKKNVSHIAGIISDYFLTITYYLSRMVYFAQATLSFQSVYSCAILALDGCDGDAYEFQAERQLAMVRALNMEFYTSLEPPEEKKKPATKGKGKTSKSKVKPDSEEEPEDEDAEDAEEEPEGAEEDAEDEDVAGESVETGEIVEGAEEEEEEDDEEEEEEEVPAPSKKPARK